ncbi:hypothetical protein TNCT_69641 [Trichonephila clavata]|nr:hypothetical protein TNCT_69621 [Trichonephila clavata]GFR05724.1 hypothetical protein TNCT_69631 [Trichonephila clavata]GFR05726.1 hypothetical protein TNCT_69641 [Trichonephila clavata]
MNVVPCRNEHYATPPPIPGGRVSVRPSRMHQNARSAGAVYCYKSFPSSTNVVPCRNEHELTPPRIPGGRVSVRPSSMNQ